MEDEQVSLSPSGQPVANFLTLSITTARSSFDKS